MTFMLNLLALLCDVCGALFGPTHIPNDNKEPL